MVELYAVYFFPPICIFDQLNVANVLFSSLYLSIVSTVVRLNFTSRERGIGDILASAGNAFPMKFVCK